MRLMTTVALRIAAGAVGTLPPIIALAILDRAAYGHAVANHALALLLLGPIEQFLGQGYLRSLVAQKEETSDPRPDGSGCVPAYMTICLGFFALLGPTFGLAPVDVAQTAALTIIILVCRVQERWFIAIGQPSTAIVLFYLSPPLALSTLVAGARFLLGLDDFVIVAFSLVLAYGGCALVSFTIQTRMAAVLLVPRIPLTIETWRREVSAAGQFILSGALLSATDICRCCC